MASVAAATNIVQKRGQASSRKRNGWRTGTNRKERETGRERDAEVRRRHHNIFLMKSEINQLHGLLDESGISQPPGGISCSAWLAGPDKDR